MNNFPCRKHVIKFGRWNFRFLRNSNGAVAVMYAISFAFLVAVTALAYDIARAHYARAHLNSTIDAIAIAVGAELQNIPVDLSTVEAGETAYEQMLIRIAKSYIIGNIGVDAYAFLDISPGDVVVTIKYAGTVETPNVAEISGTLNLPMTLASTFFNISNAETKASAKVNREVRGMELALALDTSGSMAGTKIATLKTAVSSLLDILYAGRTTIPDFYVSIVPFADDSVNVSGHSDWLLEQPSPYPQLECAKNRTNSSHDDGGDADKNPAQSLFHRDPLNGDGNNDCHTEGYWWYWWWIPDWNRSPVLELTALKTTINNLVQDIEPNGYTSTNVGLAWAWRTISPNWSGDWSVVANPDDEVPDVRPVDYDHDVIDKSIIFMTDGANTTTSGGTKDQKDIRYAATCAAIKAEGIEVFTIAFQMSASDEGIYKTCATSEIHFFSADSNSDLQNAFEAIAGKLSIMKLVE